MLYVYLVVFVQTVLESIPVSSSGHVALLTVFYQKCFDSASILSFFNEPIFEAWMYCLHGITALVLAIFFYPQWSFFLKNISRVWRILFRLIFLVGLVDVITFLGYMIVRHYDLHIPLYIGFIITAIALASLRLRFLNTTHRTFGMYDALVLGVVQSVALLPGISRFATTFVAARWLGYSNRRSFELTWMIQWPLIFAAAILGFYQLHEAYAIDDFLSLGLILAYLFSGLGAYAALYAVQWCIDKNKMEWFAYYMIVPISLAFLWSNALT